MLPCWLRTHLEDSKLKAELQELACWAMYAKDAADLDDGERSMIVKFMAALTRTSESHLAAVLLR